MKTVLLLACVVIAQGRVLVKRDARLPTPQISKITAVDPPGFQIEWDRVKADIVGYKVNLLYMFNVPKAQYILIIFYLSAVFVEV